ncbi:hypothetical protein SI65_01186 [Aspergillus cristatus]|uniref:Uncharacterized protein n=1 Tax=Aspergillus cristatus TaxID=573508 RepID=A0A1E3BRS7_ASPCR|nr:hypothetical protein SI65_01186 [Aspergillus cristatus]
MDMGMDAHVHSGVSRGAFFRFETVLNRPQQLVVRDLFHSCLHMVIGSYCRDSACGHIRNREPVVLSSPCKTGTHLPTNRAGGHVSFPHSIVWHNMLVKASSTADQASPPPTTSAYHVCIEFVCIFPSSYTGCESHEPSCSDLCGNPLQTTSYIRPWTYSDDHPIRFNHPIFIAPSLLLFDAWQPGSSAAIPAIEADIACYTFHDVFGAWLWRLGNYSSKLEHAWCCRYDWWQHVCLCDASVICWSSEVGTYDREARYCREAGWLFGDFTDSTRHHYEV